MSFEQMYQEYAMDVYRYAYHYVMIRILLKN